MPSNTILDTASQIIYGDREKTYDHPAVNLARIAKYWSTHLGVAVTMDDVCQMMILLKVARLKNQPQHYDSLVDVAGYAALAERCHRYESDKVAKVNEKQAQETNRRHQVEGITQPSYPVPTAVVPRSEVQRRPDTHSQ